MIPINKLNYINTLVKNMSNITNCSFNTNSFNMSSSFIQINGNMMSINGTQYHDVVSITIETKTECKLLNEKYINLD